MADMVSRPTLSFRSVCRANLSPCYSRRSRVGLSYRWSMPASRAARQEQQQQRWRPVRRLLVTARRGGRDDRGSQGPRRQQPAPSPTQLLKEFGLPALGLLAVGSLIGPLVGSLVVGALSLGEVSSTAGSPLWLQPTLPAILASC